MNSKYSNDHVNWNVKQWLSEWDVLNAHDDHANYTQFYEANLLKQKIPCYDFHVFICQNQRPAGSPKGCCMSKGSNKLLEHFKILVRNLKVQSILITKSGCLSKCVQGVALVIYPSGTWYSVKSLVDIEEIVTSHIQRNQIVNRLLMAI